ncbi:MAG: thymidylate synthase [Promethearchaeota archaeon]
MASVIFIDEEDVNMAWINALKRVLNEGDEISTEYDHENDPPARDSTALIRVRRPFSNPIKSRRGKEKKVLKVRSKFGNSYEVYGSLADLFLVGSIQSGYIEEILEGLNDKYIWSSTRSFPYSYHDRIFNYAPYSLEDAVHVDYDIKIIENDLIKLNEKLRYNKKIEEKDGKEIWKLANGMELELDKKISDQIGIDVITASVLDFQRINQIDLVIDKLRKSPNTRRAQAITWRPYSDPLSDDPPCLQRLYFRIKNGKLILQTTWRSRDLFKAWEANVNGMIRIQEYVAKQLGLEVGEYVDFSNSLHVYGKDIKDAKQLLEDIENLK